MMRPWVNFNTKSFLPGLFFLIVANMVFPTPTNGIGVKDYGEDCDAAHTFSQNEMERCDSTKGLYCNPVQKECKCVISGAYYQRGKCRAKVNKLCGSMDNLVVQCVKNAFCNMTGNGTDGVCQCEGVLLPNGAGTACYVNGSSQTVYINFPSTLITIFSYFIIMHR